MAEKSKRVMDMVRREVAKDPDVKSGPLYEQAKKLDRSIRSLTLRQFHARYPLQAKREAKAAEKKRRPGRKAAKRPGRKPGRRAAGRHTRAVTKKKAGRAAGRTTARTKATATGSAARATPDRDAVRRVLLDFAGEVAKADNKADMIAVIGQLDGWIDRLTA